MVSRALGNLVESGSREKINRIFGGGGGVSAGDGDGGSRRLAPNGSFQNEAECVMSSLNLALQNVAIERERMTVEVEDS